MKCIVVAAAAVNQTPLDWEGNFERIKEVIKTAEQAQVGLLCLPEMCITGYGCEDAFLSNDVHQRALDMLVKISRLTNMALCVGLPVVYRNALYNCIAMIQGGRIVGFVPKQHLAGDGIHYEPRWFKPWPAGVDGELSFSVEGFESYLTTDIPIGDLCFDFSGIRVGFEICEDAWVAERPGSLLARRGVDIILNPSASHFAFGKQDIRKRFVIEGSRAFSVTYVYANLLGNEAGRAIYDGECLIASGGKLLAQGQRFYMQDSTLTIAVVDVDATRTRQIGTASYTPDFNQAEAGVFSGVSLPVSSDMPTNPIADLPELPPTLEFSHAVSLGLFDYLRKSRSKGFVISLSGGADSAACAYLVRTMVARGLNELGEAKFCKRLGMPWSEGTYNREAIRASICRQLLTCVYQSTKNSSETTLNAAKAVAKDAGAKFHSIDVDKLVNDYTSIVAVALQHDFSWEKDDLALQNIQARVRAPSVWMIANVENKLLITTSNRSEAAVGYCTMDGDTAGSIAPLGGIDKDFLLRWLRSVGSDEPLYAFPKEGLGLILKQAPTAELRPGESQTDEKDLMPYSVLEFIEDKAVLERRSPRDVYLLLRENNRAHFLDAPTAYMYVEKFFKLWCRNQWKRERYALSFHVDDKNLDPRSWCRFPVLSGGYEVELRELKQELGLGL
jgi:NAD+ synthase (glutamine-hydrolysing)